MGIRVRVKEASMFSKPLKVVNNVKSSSSVGRQNYGTSFQILLWGRARSMLSRERLMIPVRAATACHRRMACFTRPRPRRSFSTTTTTTTILQDLIRKCSQKNFLEILKSRRISCKILPKIKVRGKRFKFFP